MKSILAFAVVMLLSTGALAEECIDFSEWKTKVDVQLDSAQINPGAEPGSFVLTYTTEGHDDSYVFFAQEHVDAGFYEFSTRVVLGDSSDGFTVTLEGAPETDSRQKLEVVSTQRLTLDIKQRVIVEEAREVEVRIRTVPSDAQYVESVVGPTLLCKTSDIP